MSEQKTIKLTAKSVTIYSLRSHEVSAIANAVSNATHMACVNLHAQQCEAVGDSNISEAARVEIVMQLAKLSALIERAGFNQCNRINLP